MKQHCKGGSWYALFMGYGGLNTISPYNAALEGSLNSYRSQLNPAPTQLELPNQSFPIGMSTLATPINPQTNYQALKV